MPKDVPSLLLLLGLAGGACAPSDEGAFTWPSEGSPQVLSGPLFLSQEGRVLQDGLVVISGDSVLCSGTPADCPYPADEDVREIQGGTILPGLIDLHVHARPSYLAAFLPAGVTTIRDANNTLAVVDSLRSASNGPRIFASGPLLDGPSSTMTSMSATAGALDDYPLEELVPVLVEDSTAAADAVEALADAGVDFVKLYQRLPVEAFRSAAAAAHAHGLPVATDLGMVFTAGLQGSEVDIVEAAEAGVSTLEHLSGLALAYQRRGGDPLSPPYNAETLDDIAERLLRTGVAAVPTVATFVRFADPGALSMEDVPGAQFDSPFQPRWEAVAGFASQQQDAVAADRELTTTLLQRLHEGGMLIGAGSDLPAGPGMVPGGALHMELAALVEAGLTPAEALQAATWNAARILAAEDLGHLQPGAAADILIVDGDPTVDITATRHVRAVFAGGREVDIEGAWERLAAALEGMAGEHDG